MFSFQDWYSVINIEKLLLPKLYRVLQNGGQYSPSIYLYLLPFISQFLKVVTLITCTQISLLTCDKGIYSIN